MGDVTRVRARAIPASHPPEHDSVRISIAPGVRHTVPGMSLDVTRVSNPWLR